MAWGNKVGVWRISEPNRAKAVFLRKVAQLARPKKPTPTMTGHGSWRSTAVLLSTCVSLAAIVVLELARELPLAREAKAAAPATVGLGPIFESPGFQPPSADQVRTIATRPLFSASRRPFAPAAKPDAIVPAPNIPPELIGVLITERSRAALVRAVGSDMSNWVREGENIAGWRIEAVDLRQVTVSLGGRLEIVGLRPDSAARGSTQSESGDSSLAQEAEPPSAEAQSEAKDGQTR